MAAVSNMGFTAAGFDAVLKFDGKRIEDMTREELLQVIAHLVTELNDERRKHRVTRGDVVYRVTPRW